MEIGLFNVLSCREASRRLAEGRWDEAPLAARALILLHLAYCRHCRRFRRELLLIARAARLWAGSLDPARLRLSEDRLIQRLSSKDGA